MACPGETIKIVLKENTMGEKNVEGARKQTRKKKKETSKRCRRRGGRLTQDTNYIYSEGKKTSLATRGFKRKVP